ncbi:JAB domain-containing protein [Pseudobacillus wudalianchiensis]|uniref:JAB domain-containing protein n=1 Tax=Pseudobacillus wudalianchiensis TaxID=1743143 RepID=UPI00316AEC43
MPSGETTSSPEDIEVTERLVQAGNIIRVDVLDHVVLGDNCYGSLKEKGYF